jgi:hypothetical protein
MADDLIGIAALKAIAAEKLKLKSNSENNGAGSYQNNYEFACFNSAQILPDKSLVIKTTVYSI